MQASCQCRTPTCDNCKRPVLIAQAPKPVSIEVKPSKNIIPSQIDILSSLPHTLETIDDGEVKRAICFVTKTYDFLHRTKDAFLRSLSKLELISCLCDEVGQDTEPILAFLALLNVGSSSSKEIEKFIKMLLEHQEALQTASQCMECTSPPSSPTNDVPYTPFNVLAFNGEFQYLSSSDYQHFSSYVFPVEESWPL